MNAIKHVLIVSKKPFGRPLCNLNTATDRRIWPVLFMLDTRSSHPVVLIVLGPSIRLCSMAVKLPLPADREQRIKTLE